jgi:hypothetical protein
LKNSDKVKQYINTNDGGNLGEEISAIVNYITDLEEVEELLILLRLLLNYVSKIMKTSDAETDLKEFVVIGKLDPTNEYHLGTPIICKPDLNERDAIDDINKCKNINYGDVKRYPNRYSLLLLKFGGANFKDLADKYFTQYLSQDKQERTDRFWLEAHRLIMGLKF